MQEVTQSMLFEWRQCTRACAVCALALLVGCQSLTEHASTTAVNAPAKTADEDTGIAGQIMMAEFEISRENPEAAVSGYLSAANRSQNPEVAQRALFLARQFGSVEQQAQALARWTELAPDEVAVLETTLISQVEAGQIDAFERTLEKILSLNPEYPGQWLASLWGNTDPEQQPALALALTRVAAEYSNGPLALVVSEIRNQVEPGTGLDWLDVWLTTHPLTSELALYRAQAMLPDRSAALQYLEAIEPDLKTAPVLSQMARWHGLDGNESAALTLMTEAVELDGARDQDRLTLALLWMQKSQWDEAERILKDLLGREELRASAYYHLGSIAATQGKTELAIDRFLRVEQGQLIVDARRQLAQLALEQKNPDQAARWFAEGRLLFPAFTQDLLIAEAQFELVHDEPEIAVTLLSEAVSNDPSDRQLLYLRALAYERVDRIDAAEADLRSILVVNPEDADALNALGYTLADRTDRYEEAYDLIKRALSKAPESPAILDSMGWVLYKLGRPDEGLPYLEKAWSLMPDHEIAAHLGEVLWALQRTDEARRIWKAGYELTPESDIISATIERLTAS